MGRGRGVPAEAGRTFWPSAPEAVARHKTPKMNRRVILQVSQTAAKTELAVPRRRHCPTVQVPFCFGLENKKRARSFRVGTKKTPLRPAVAKMCGRFPRLRSGCFG